MKNHLGHGSNKSITVRRMFKLWNEYVEECDNAKVIRTEFSQKDSDFVTREIPAPITVTIKGFCLNKLKMTESNFYATYNKDPEFELVIARMKEHCEVDARCKFENGSINPKLAGLWMSHYGYSTQIKEDITSDNSLDIKIDYGGRDGANDTSE